MIKANAITGERYQAECLVPNLPILLRKVGRKQRMFMQDGAKPHTSIANKQWFKDNGVLLLAGWPARSCGANPTENMWARVAAAVSRRGPWGHAQLMQFIQEEWDRIPQADVNALVASFTKRLESVVAGKGQ
jgi:hypothetical protein